MSPTVLPPPPAPPDRQRTRVRFAEDPEARSVHIGLLGTILLHVLLFLLAPFLFRLAPSRALVTPPPQQEFNIDLAQEEAKEPPKPPQPNRYVETNPDAPENVPDKTNNFASQNQQVAQEKPTPDGKSDRPATEGKKDFASNQIVSGRLTQPIEHVEAQPPPSALPEAEQKVT